MAGIYSQGGSAGHRYAGWLSEVEAKNFQFGGKVFNGSPSAIYVGSNRVWMPGGWLESAAVRAILGAFGQRDGWAVIKATNAYLNQLAASGQAGKDKATALAGFINEDPMMVCSLGLEVEGVTMPIRFLRSAKNGYIDMPIVYNTQQNTIYAKYMYRGTSMSEGSGLFGSYNQLCIQCYYRRAGFNQSTYATTLDHSAANVPLEAFISAAKRELLEDGISKATNTASYTTSADHSSLRLFVQGTDPANYNMNGGLAVLQVDDNNWIVPYDNDGTPTLIDIQTGYVGTPSNIPNFTFEYWKKVNGQWVTWTPSTP